MNTTNALSNTVNLNALAVDVHSYAKEKGWWEKPRSDEEVIMLMVTEIAEATECVRNSEPHHHYGLHEKQDAKTSEKSYLLPSSLDELRLDQVTKKPEGEAVELVDCQIRIADFCGYAGIEMEREMKSLISELNNDRFYSSRLKRANPLERHLAIVERLAIAGRSAYKHNEELMTENVIEAFFMIREIFRLNNWNWEFILREKMSYNQKRPYRHGGKAY